MPELNVRVVSDITKEYPQMIKVVIYKEPKFFVNSDHPKRERELVGDDYVPAVSSLQRTKTLIRDLVLCNGFELFCTFTFDPKKVYLNDTTNFSACFQKMSTWLHHQRDNSRRLGVEFKYLIVPERHKSGRWHFHALISGYTGTLKDSKYTTSTLRPIYNITSFRSGFTTAVKVDSADALSSYVTKYITKDFIKTFNQKRFFCSRNLNRPIKTTNSGILSYVLPLFRRKVGENAQTLEYCIDKSDLVCNTGSVPHSMSYNVERANLNRHY